MSGAERLLQILGLRPVAHRPSLGWRFWIYSAAAYLMPVVVLLAFPAEGGSLDELVWLVILVPAFLLSLHYGLRGAFVALLLGTALLVVVQLALLVGSTPDDPRITVPIYIAYGALAISVGWLSEQLHEHYGRALELESAQKTEALGTLAAGIAHDFNNVLTAMVANAELLAGDLQAGEGERHELVRLRETASRGAGMVRNLLGLSRRGMLALRPLDLSAFLREREERLRKLLPPSIALEVRCADGVPTVLADHPAVDQILVNLVTNAREATGFGGRVTIEVERGEIDEEHRSRHGWGDPGEYARVVVRDTGTGMDEETLGRVFEPFFTPEGKGEGIGLGMAMTYGLMKQHRGFVDVRSAPGEGTEVRLFFRLPRHAPAPVEPAASSARSGGSERILLVEDEEAIRDAGRRILQRLGYHVEVAADGEEGLEVYRASSEGFDLLLTDVMLPGCTGPELFEAIRHEPGAPAVLFMSGYPARTIQSRTSLTPNLAFLPKPWSVQELAAAVREVLDAGSPEGAASGEAGEVERTVADRALAGDSIEARGDY